MENTENTAMINLNHRNWLIWKPKMEYVFYCNNLYDPFGGDKTRPKDMPITEMLNNERVLPSWLLLRFERRKR